MGAIILDTETTGIDEPDVIELAYAGPFETITPPEGVQPKIHRQRFKPTKPIQLGAMVTHHILPEDLESEPLWVSPWPLPSGVDVLIGHNIDFDWKAIGSPQVRRICTLALARFLWPELDSHSLSALSYHFGDKPAVRRILQRAHEATVDVYLVGVLMTQLFLALPTVRTWDDLWQASEKARMPTRFTFGKYGPDKGKPGELIEAVRRFDPGYIEWCIFKCDMCADPYWQGALRGIAGPFGKTS